MTAQPVSAANREHGPGIDRSPPETDGPIDGLYDAGALLGVLITNLEILDQPAAGDLQSIRRSLQLVRRLVNDGLDALEMMEAFVHFGGGVEA